MAIEDFTTYSETDPNSRITRATRRVAWTDLTKNEDAYVYKDKGAAFFDGDFVYYLTIRSIGFSGLVGLKANCAYWALANLVGDYTYIKDDNSGDGLFLWARTATTGSHHYIRLQELDSGQVYEGTDYEITVNTSYYLKIVRDESVGTYGTLYCYTYSDSARTNLLNTQSIALHSSKKDYRYIYAVQSINSAQVIRHSGYSEDLELFALLTGDLQLANTYTTDFTDTSVTGNAYIINTGLSSVTEHGHVWGTTFNPTTADSKTTLGAGSLGLFSSSVTGLIAGQQYYMRAYATNSEGTAYSPNIRLIAGRRGTLLLSGEIVVKGEYIAYVSESGKRRKILGDEY